MAETGISTAGTPLTGRRVVLGVGGGIAAYKSPDLVRRLRDLGAEVQVVMTKGAAAFITPLTLQAVSGNPVRTSLLDPAAEAAMGHIELARWADLVLVAPASANLMARLAAGMADDLLTTLVLATAAPIALAPAMNQQMWQHPATQTNANSLVQRGVTLLGPGVGDQACGDVGPGRMLEAVDLARAAADLLAQQEPASGPNGTSPENTPENTPGSMAGCRVLITAGPTREAIDPVRYISNHSSGKQGYALATAAAAAGATVTLVSGPVALATPAGVTRIDVISALEMHAAVQAQLASTDVFIGVAAVADFRPATAAERKIKKGQDVSGSMDLQLTENPDIIAAVAAHHPRPITVGFAAETDQVLEHARAKRKRKHLDLIVANDVSDQSIGFGADQNLVTLISADSEESIGPLPKGELATAIIQRLARHWQQGSGTL